MKNFNLNQAASWLNHRTQSIQIKNDDTDCLSVSIDSRTLEPGALFVAIHGPNFDGHDYVGVAKQKGAVAAMVERQVSIDTRGRPDPACLSTVESHSKVFRPSPADRCEPRF